MNALSPLQILNCPNSGLNSLPSPPLWGSRSEAQRPTATATPATDCRTEVRDAVVGEPATTGIIWFLFPTKPMIGSYLKLEHRLLITWMSYKPSSPFVS